MNAPAPPTVADRPPVVFQLAPEYRRIGVYLLVGWLPLVGAVGVLLAYDLLPEKNRLADDRTWAFIIAATIFSAAMLVPAILIFRYRLRIDHAGVWRRRFFRWDLWSWAAFTDGRVRQGVSPLNLEFATKRWPFRRMSAIYLSDEDSDALAARIRDVLPPPPSPELPPKVGFRIYLGKRIEFSRDGLRLLSTRQANDRHYGWTEVRLVRVTRADHTHRDFSRLEIELAALSKPVRLYNQGGDPNVRRQNAMVVMQYIEQHLPPERIEITATSGPPRTVEEADRRLVELDRRDRLLRKARWIMLLLSIAGCAAVAQISLGKRDLANWDWTHWCGAGAMLLLLNLYPIGIWVVDVHDRKQVGIAREKLLMWREDLVKHS